MPHRHRSGRGLASLALVAVTLAGCKAPSTVAAQTTEGVIRGDRPGNGQTVGVTRALKLRRPDGSPLNGTVMIDGRSYTAENGVVNLPESVYQDAVARGNLVVVMPGFAPVALDPRAVLESGITLSPLGSLGPALAYGGTGGKLASQDGAISFAVPAGLFSGAGKLTLSGYVPSGTADAAAALYQQDLAKLYQSRGLPAPANGACPAPLACLPVQQALGIAITADGTLSASGQTGTFTATYDLAAMLHGWDGKGTPPWETGATGWTDEMKAEALAAAKILATYQALATAGQSAWGSAFQSTFGLQLNGTVLTFPVSLSADAIASGITRVRIPGTELLGASLEVTLSTPDINASFGLDPSGQPIDPSKVILPDGTTAQQILDATLPTADPTGATALAARKSIPLPGVTRPGSTLATGLSLSTSAPTGSGDIVAGTGTTPVKLDPNAVPGATSTSLLANNASSILANTSAGLISNGGSGLLAKSGSPIVSNNNGSLVASGIAGVISNNNGSLISNNTGSLVSNNSSGIVSNNNGSLVPGDIVLDAGGNIVANNGGQLVANNGGQAVQVSGTALLSNNSSGLIANNGGQITGFPYLPVAPVLAKYDLFQLGVPLPPAQRVSPTGLVEWLWEGLAVRAIDVEGTPLTDWTSTDGTGQFRLDINGDTPAVFFLEASGNANKVHSYTMVFAPGTNQTVAAMDSSTSQMAIGTVQLYNYIPPEASRLEALASMFKQSANKATSAASQTSPKSPLFQKLSSQANNAKASYMLILARLAELNTSWHAFDPTQFSGDRVADYSVITTNTAISNAQSDDSVAIYNTLYDETTTRKLDPNSLLPISLVSPF